MIPTRHEVSRIGVLSAIRIGFFLSWIAGILLACLYGLLYHFVFRFDPESFEAQIVQMGVDTNGVVFVVIGGFFLSIVCAFLGAIGVGVLAAAYNGLAHVVGGVEVTWGMEASAGDRTDAGDPAVDFQDRWRADSSSDP